MSARFEHMLCSHELLVLGNNITIEHRLRQSGGVASRRPIVIFLRYYAWEYTLRESYPILSSIFANGLSKPISLLS